MAMAMMHKYLDQDLRVILSSTTSAQNSKIELFVDKTLRRCMPSTVGVGRSNALAAAMAGHKGAMALRNVVCDVLVFAVMDQVSSNHHEQAELNALLKCANSQIVLIGSVPNLTDERRLYSSITNRAIGLRAMIGVQFFQWSRLSHAPKKIHYGELDVVVRRGDNFLFGVIFRSGSVFLGTNMYSVKRHPLAGGWRPPPVVTNDLSNAGKFDGHVIPTPATHLHVFASHNRQVIAMLQEYGLSVEIGQIITSLVFDISGGRFWYDADYRAPRMISVLETEVQSYPLQQWTRHNFDRLSSNEQSARLSVLIEAAFLLSHFDVEQILSTPDSLWAPTHDDPYKTKVPMYPGEGRRLLTLQKKFIKNRMAETTNYAFQRFFAEDVQWVERRQVWGVYSQLCVDVFNASNHHVHRELKYTHWARLFHRHPALAMALVYMDNQIMLRNIA